MTVTTLPYMEAVEQADSVREGWYKLECQLCEFETFAGAFHVCEDEAADHLDECHPRRRKLADDEMRARRARLVEQLAGPPEIIKVDPPMSILTRPQDWGEKPRGILWPGLAVPAGVIKTHHGVTIGYVGQSEADRLRAMPSAAEVRAMTDHVNSMMTSRKATN